MESSMERLTAPAAAPPGKTTSMTKKKTANDDDDYDDDYDYFTSTYRPLSNLPTPPPSAQASLVQSPVQDGHLESSLLGPAVHLVNMLPPACSIVTPSVPLVQAMLTRAQLPIHTVALAVCILDSLDARFARAWRAVCPPGLTEPTEKTPAAEKRHTLPSPLTPLTPLTPPVDFCSPRPRRHIDAVFPEVIILAALVIAAKFDDDGHATQQPAQAYCAAWGSSVALWTGAQLAATERCIMQSLDYRILPLVDDDLLADAAADMRRAGQQALRAQARAAAAAAASAAAASSSSAVATTMATPAPSPPPTAGLSLPAMPSTATTSTSPSPASPIIIISPDNASLTRVQRRHHVPSHSECLGRFTYEH